MKFIKIHLIYTLLFFSSFGYSCTTFVLKTQNDLLFGRNLDWVSENGIIVTNHRGILKKALVFSANNKPLSWTSKYGSITFNQFGKEFPFGGMNEKGLVIEIMKAHANYPAIDSRPAVNEVQWIQYHLDTSSSVDELIASAKKMRISKINQELHYLVCDASGNTAVIEFIGGRMKVYKDKKLPIAVLENSLYHESLKQKRDKEKCRFSTVSEMLTAFNPSGKINALDFSFNILKEVELDGSWSIVYDIKNMKIYFKTASNQAISCLDFNKFDYSCGVNPKLYPLTDGGEGDITANFTLFSSKENKRILKDAMKTNEIHLPLSVKKQFYEYHKTCICRED